MQKIKLYQIVTLALLFLVACTSEMKKDNEDGVVVTDDLERKVTFNKEPEKVLSLTSSITEILYCIVSEDRIIARTPYDSVPKAVLKKEVVNNYPIDFEKIVLLKPDVIFAKEGIISLDDAEKIESLGVPVYFQKYDDLEDIFIGIKELGQLLGEEERAEAVADSLKSLAKKNCANFDPDKAPSVLMVISEDPVYVFGKDSYASSIIEAAGGRNAVDKVFSNTFPSLRREYMLKINPDVIIGVDSGSFFNLYPELKNTNAYKSKRIFQINKELVSRPGPRVIEAIKALKEVIHEE